VPGIFYFAACLDTAGTCGEYKLQRRHFRKFTILKRVVWYNFPITAFIYGTEG
jgi:hypothetical protein